MFGRILNREELEQIWNKTWPGVVQREKEELRGHIAILERGYNAQLEVNMAQSRLDGEQRLEILRLNALITDLETDAREQEKRSQFLLHTLDDAYKHQFDLRQTLADQLLEQNKLILSLQDDLRHVGSAHVEVSEEEPPIPILEHPEQVLTIDSQGTVSEEVPARTEDPAA